jgi:hypothetical protein
VSWLKFCLGGVVLPDRLLLTLRLEWGGCPVPTHAPPYIALHSGMGVLYCNIGQGSFSNLPHPRLLHHQPKQSFLVGSAYHLHFALQLSIQLHQSATFTMTSDPMSVDSSALDPPHPPESTADEPKYGGFSRFELELEVCILQTEAALRSGG